jgi:L-lactate dehydrogenase
MVTNPVDILTRLFAETSGCRRVGAVGEFLAYLFDGDGGGFAVDGGSRRADDGVVVLADRSRLQHRHRPIPPHPRQRINAGIGRTRSGPAGAVLATLRKTLGLQDGIEELSVNHDGNWYGIPLHFTAATPTVCLPQLSTGEARQLAAAARKLHTAYRHLTGGPS